MCRIQGFLSAEVALEGDKNVGNDSCVLNQENNKICDTFEREKSTSCNNTNEAVAVCKGKDIEFVANLRFLKTSCKLPCIPQFNVILITVK